jgi:hypothetical protein
MPDSFNLLDTARKSANTSTVALMVLEQTFRNLSETGAPTLFKGTTSLAGRTYISSRQMKASGMHSELKRFHLQSTYHCDLYCFWNSVTMIAFYCRLQWPRRAYFQKSPIRKRWPQDAEWKGCQAPCSHWPARCNHSFSPTDQQDGPSSLLPLLPLLHCHYPSPAESPSLSH